MTHSRELRASLGIGSGTTVESVLSQTLRHAHLLEGAHRAAFLLDVLKNYRRNQRFRQRNPEFACPPAYVLFESQATTSLEYFRTGGINHAQFIDQTLRPFLPAGPLALCEWGCGPARIIRHFRTLDAGRWADVHGCDYNAQAIRWDQEHIANVTFAVNGIAPPLPYPDDRFDAIYSSSVLTHIPGRLQQSWLVENLRVVKPGGVVLFSVHGDAYRGRFLPHERRQYDDAGFVERGEVKPGWAWYTTYHNPRWVRDRFLAGYEILDAKLTPEFGPLQQDVWVVRKQREVSRLRVAGS
jgi:SAM-dependent methyltransferase